LSNFKASDLYHEGTVATVTSPLLLGNMSMLGQIPNISPRRQLYSKILSRVRVALIRRMPKPEEVLIVEDENGEIVRETMKDSDAITLYKSMRETLIFLTHLDYEDTQNIMLEKLAAQVTLFVLFSFLYPFFRWMDLSGRGIILILYVGQLVLFMEH
jgi:exportin-1